VHQIGYLQEYFETLRSTHTMSPALHLTRLDSLAEPL